MRKLYHYTDSGLDDVYLKDGFETIDTPYGKAIKIAGRESLHKAISKYLIGKKIALRPDEFRYLRHEMDMTLANLAEILGVTEQTPLRWETGETKIPRLTDIFIRSLASERLFNKPMRVEKLVKSEIYKSARSVEVKAMAKFQRNPRSWVVADAA